MYRLGEFFSKGSNGIPKSAERAVAAFRFAARQRFPPCPEAAEALADCCLRGKGTARSPAEAAGWYSLAGTAVGGGIPVNPLMHAPSA